MANSKSVDELYLKLGLDLSGLDKDFVDAQQTVKTNIGRLKGEQNRIKLGLDIDTASLGPAITKGQKLALQEAALTKQLKLQEQVVAMAKAEYDAMAAAKGKNATASKRLETALLKEQKAMANLNLNYQKLQKGYTGGFGGKAKANVDGFTASLSGLQGALLQVTAVMGTAAGVVTFAKSSLDASEAIYGLHERLSISVTEAEKLDTLLQVSGVSAEAFTGVMVKLNKQMLTAGDGGNETTKMLDRFGVKLTDAQGNLLPMTQELEALSQGYQKAAASGEQEAYITQVLGVRGQVMVEMLREYTDLQARAGTIKGGSIMDPDEAHQLALDWSDMTVQLGKMADTVGSVLLPNLKNLIPVIKEVTGAIAQASKDKSLIGNGLMAVVDTAKGFLMGPVGSPLEQYANVRGGQLNAKRKETEDILGRPMTDNDALLRYNEDTGHYEKQTAEENAAKIAESLALGPFASLLVDTHIWQQVTEEEQKVIDTTKDMGKTDADTAKQMQASAAKKAEAEKKYQAILKATQELSKETDKLTKNDLEQSLDAVRQKLEAAKKAGVDEITLKQYAEAQKAKIAEDYADNVTAKLSEAWQSELDIRLAAIDKEAKAWKKKGADEVAATKWAEEEKRNAVRNTALDAIKNNRKRLEELRDAMGSGPTTGYGLDKNGKRIDFNFEHGGSQAAMAELSRQWIEEDRAKLGIKAGDVFSPELIQTFAQMQKYTQNQIVPGLESSMPLPVPQLAQLGNEGQSGRNTKNVNVASPQITVQINNPLVQDNASITELADQVADKIGPAILEAIGGNDNGY